METKCYFHKPQRSFLPLRRKLSELNLKLHCTQVLWALPVGPALYLTLPLFSSPQDGSGLCYPSRTAHAQTFSYLLLDPARRHVHALYHRFGGGAPWARRGGRGLRGASRPCGGTVGDGTLRATRVRRGPCCCFPGVWPFWFFFSPEFWSSWCCFPEFWPI